jgi:hypothetical protein
VEIRNDSAYVPSEPYSIATDCGGIVKWNGTFTSFDCGKTLESIANGLIGGYEGLWHAGLTEFLGPASIYEYNLDGTLNALICKGTYRGSVSSLIYDQQVPYGTV